MLRVNRSSADRRRLSRASASQKPTVEYTEISALLQKKLIEHGIKFRADQIGAASRAIARHLRNQPQKIPTTIKRFIRLWKRLKRPPTIMDIRANYSRHRLEGIPVIVKPIRGVFRQKATTGDDWRDRYIKTRKMHAEIDEHLEQEFAGTLGSHVVTLKLNWKNWAQQFFARNNRYPTEKEILSWCNNFAEFLEHTARPTPEKYGLFLARQRAKIRVRKPIT